MTYSPIKAWLKRIREWIFRPKLKVNYTGPAKINFGFSDLLTPVTQEGLEALQKPVMDRMVEIFAERARIASNEEIEAIQEAKP